MSTKKENRKKDAGRKDATNATTLWKDRFFTPEEIAQMEAVFNERFYNDLQRDENISFEGCYEKGICYLTLTLKNEEETFYYPFETAISSTDHPFLKAEDARLALLDFIGAYFDDYFANQREVFIPIDWVPYRMEELNIYAKGQVLNKKLESMADDILKSAGFDSDGHRICPENGEPKKGKDRKKS